MPRVNQNESDKRISILKKHLKQQCAAGCDGQWLMCAKQVVQQNGINLYYFALAPASVTGKRKTEVIEYFAYWTHKLWEIIFTQSTGDYVPCHWKVCLGWIR